MNDITRYMNAMDVSENSLKMEIAKEIIYSRV